MAINDQILRGYLQDFEQQHGLEKLSEPDLFAQFVTFCIVSKQAGTPSTLDDLQTDGAHDTGIDAIAVLINGRVVIDKEDVDFFRQLGRLEVEFIFVQSKTASKFDSGDIGNFLFGVRNFFSASSSVKSNESISTYREIKDYVYQNSINFAGRPILRIYYASTGKWTDDEYLSARVKTETDALKATGLFDDVRFAPLDIERLKSLYRELRQRVETEVIFEKHTILPKIDRVQEAYLGILPSSEFLKLTTDDEGELQKSLFYDNVRDFQGDNPVNREIADTLGRVKEAESFVLLNNGITIVAKSINKVGASFRISDYQIVNGCQTSHVLHLNRDKLSETMYVPVKLIVTDDPELTNQIIKATNRQTEVKLEAFESLTPFHRTLEEFYASFGKDSDKRLYYERRSKQYANTPIKATVIITLAAQSKCFLAMFLNEPHSTHRYYGEILSSNRDRLFAESHSPFPYYTSALALIRIEQFIREGELPYVIRPFKYHLLLLFRLKIGGGDHPPLEGKGADEYSKILCEVLWKPTQALNCFRECAAELRAKLNVFSGEQRLANRLRDFTSQLIPGRRQRPNGIVKYWNLDRGFGFVLADDGRDIFVHYSAIREAVHKYLREGERVEFDVSQSEKGYQARDLRILPIGTKS